MTQTETMLIDEMRTAAVYLRNIASGLVYPERAQIEVQAACFEALVARYAPAPHAAEVPAEQAANASAWLAANNVD